MNSTVVPTDEYIRLKRLEDSALALYEAGHWNCFQLGKGEQEKLWERLRDDLGLNEGHATNLGLGPTLE